MKIQRGLSDLLEIKRKFSNAGFSGGMFVNVLYSAFRLATGIIYSSIWFIALGIYHFTLGALRFFLFICYRKTVRQPEKFGLNYEVNRYLLCATALMLTDIPMGFIVYLTVTTESGFYYPGYIIYLSATYTFYMATRAIINFIRTKKNKSPVRSAMKIVDLVAAAMSVLGLQTAMIACFSHNSESYRVMMNALTGAGVCFGVMAIVGYMFVKVFNGGY